MGLPAFILRRGGGRQACLEARSGSLEGGREDSHLKPGCLGPPGK